MSTDFPPTPSIDARVQALERLTTTLNARIEQLSQDMSASFRQSVTYQEHRFKLLEEAMASLASKDDLAAMKNEILSAFKQLLTVIDARLPPKEG
jgi:exonuclease VII large subunit